jgi:hypothetical protein
MSQQTTYLSFGSGDSAETIDDYKLSFILTINSVGSFTSKTLMNEDGSVTVFYKGNIRSTENVTIKELGLINCQYCSSTCPVLMYRKVLETPIELTANVPAAITFDITFPNIMPDY